MKIYAKMLNYLAPQNLLDGVAPRDGAVSS